MSSISCRLLRYESEGHAEGDKPPVAYDMLLEVSCSPQTDLQQAMSEMPAARMQTVLADQTRRLGCLLLSAHINMIRQTGRTILVQSHTDDLPMVILALYMVSMFGTLYNVERDSDVFFQI